VITINKKKRQKLKHSLTLKMGLWAETRDELRKKTVNKIHGQPTDQDLTKLEKQLISIAASIPSALGRGNHGHTGIILEPTKYLAMTTAAFVAPNHPGIYPAGLALNAAAGTRAREVALHKEQLAQFEIFKGVEQALKDIILEVLEHDYLLEIKDDTLGFLNQTPRQMINHLKIRGRALDFADTKTLLFLNVTRNGTSARTPKFTSTESKKQ
jgi:hypothetical protein